VSALGSLAEVLSDEQRVELVEPLSDTMSDCHGHVRYAAAGALGGLKDERTTDLLIAALDDSADGYWGPVKVAAVKALAEFGPEFAENLVPLLDDCFASRRAVLKVFEEWEWEPATAKERALFHVARGYYWDAVAEGEHAVEPLISALIDQEATELWLRLAAGGTLNGTEGDCVDERKDDYDRIAEELSKLSVEGKASELIDALGPEDTYHLLDRNRAIVRVLGATGDPRAYETLVQRLDSHDDLIATYAATSLGAMGDTRAIKPLMKIAEGDRTEPKTLAAAIAALRLGYKEAIPLLVPAMWNADRHPVSGSFLWQKGLDEELETAVELLEAFGEEGRAALKRLVDCPGASNAGSVLKRLEEADEAKELAAQKDAERQLQERLQAVDADQLAEALTDDEALMRLAAVKSVVQTDGTVELLEAALGDSDARVRLAAVNGIVELRSVDSTDQLAGLLADSDDGVRSSVIEGLAKLADPQSIPTLAQRLLAKAETKEIKSLIAKTLDQFEVDGERLHKATVASKQARELLSALSHKEAMYVDFAREDWSYTPGGEEHVPQLQTLLEADGSKLGLAQLVHAAELDGVQIVLSNECGPYSHPDVDCSMVRQLAKQELRRRVDALDPAKQSERAAPQPTTDSAQARDERPAEPTTEKAEVRPSSSELVYTCRCGKQYRVKSEYLGKRVKCKKCGSSGVVQ
jgi:HEAT repeat protein